MVKQMSGLFYSGQSVRADLRKYLWCIWQ